MRKLIFLITIFMVPLTPIQAYAQEPDYTFAKLAVEFGIMEVKEQERKDFFEKVAKAIDCDLTNTLDLSAYKESVEWFNTYERLYKNTPDNYIADEQYENVQAKAFFIVRHMRSANANYVDFVEYHEEGNPPLNKYYLEKIQEMRREDPFSKKALKEINKSVELFNVYYEKLMSEHLCLVDFMKHPK